MFSIGLTQNAQTKPISNLPPKLPQNYTVFRIYTSLVLSLKINERDDGDGEQHQRDHDDGPPTSSRATVRFCSLSLSAFFSLLLLYFFNVCANVSPHVAFREEEVL